MRITRDRFGERFPDRQPPALKTIWANVRKLSQHGTILNLAMNGQVNTQNVREYAAARQPPEFNFDVNISREKLTVWIELCGNGQTIGPFVFNRNIDGLNYLQMINKDVIPQLQQHFQRQAGGAFRNLWWVQDGAPAHRLVAVRERLREFFGQRVIALYHNVDLYFKYICTLIIRSWPCPKCTFILLYITLNL